MAKVGDQLPDIILKNEQDKEVKVAELTATKGAVFFMYPKANTPGCTSQACGFRDEYDGIQKAGYSVFGLSADAPKSLLNWKTKNNFQYHLLSDPKKTLIKFFGAEKPGGKPTLIILPGIIRSHVVVGKGGLVEDVQIKVSPGASVERAVEFVSKSTDLKRDAEKSDDEEAKPAKKKVATSPKAVSKAKPSPKKSATSPKIKGTTTKSTTSNSKAKRPAKGDRKSARLNK